VGDSDVGLWFELEDVFFLARFALDAPAAADELIVGLVDAPSLEPAPAEVGGYGSYRLLRFEPAVSWWCPPWCPPCWACWEWTSDPDAVPAPDDSSSIFVFCPVDGGPRLPMGGADGVAP